MQTDQTRCSPTSTLHSVSSIDEDRDFLRGGDAPEEEEEKEELAPEGLEEERARQGMVLIAYTSSQLLPSQYTANAS